MTTQDVKEIIKAFSESDAVEMELSIADGSLCLKKAEAVVPAGVMAGYDTAASGGERNDGAKAPGTEATGRINAADREKASGAAPAEGLAAPDAEHDLIAVKAPLAGTFYRSPSPDEPAYVEAGQMVKKGATIGLIEAMKVMNEIPAPADGIMKEIIAENEAFVSYDEVLMQIKPEG